jgi:hypothetical protein
MKNNELHRLINRYESSSSIELNEALDAVRQLLNDGEISEKLAKNIIRVLISNHVYDSLTDDIKDEIYHSKHPNNSLKFTGIRYGRQHETYA